MTMVYRCISNDEPLKREVSGIYVFGGAPYQQRSLIAIPKPYDGQPLKWGGSVEEAAPLAAAILADCLALDQQNSKGGASSDDPAAGITASLHQEFAETFICQTDAAEPFALGWLEVQAWLDERGLGGSGALARCINNIRDFEALLSAAIADGGESRGHRIAPQLWEMWNVEAFADLCIDRRYLDPGLLQRFADHLLDLKFKLYSIAEVDVPIYAAAKEKWGLDQENPQTTPHGFATRLSEEVTLIVKSRSAWESIMNIVYWYSVGKDLQGISATDELGISYKSKQAKFFPWVAGQPLWSSLASFRPLVEGLDQLRTSEVHRLSRVRSNFARSTLEPIGQCVELVNTILSYVLDHFVAAIALGCTATYDVTAKTPITLG